MRISKTLLAIAAAATVTASLAAVTFNAASGTGFVGKGDVQLAFGWNNQQANANASLLSFNTVETISYDAVCEWDTVTGGKESKVIHHIVTNTKTSQINGSVAYDVRKGAGIANVNGFNLTGYGSQVTVGDPVPMVGAACAPGSDNAGTSGMLTAVTPSADNAPATLYVSFGGQNVALPY